jgi:hypothetical protein
MVFRELNLCFIHIPKCGGSSITMQYHRKHEGGIHSTVGKTWRPGLEVEMYRPIGREGQIQKLHNMHADADQYYPVFREYGMITQVRYPLDRFASAWKHLASVNLVDTPFDKWVPRAIENLYEGHWARSLDYPEQYIQHLSVINPGFDASILFKHQYTFLRPEVEVHKLEAGTIWERLNLKALLHNNSLPKYEAKWTRHNEMLVGDYYERDFIEFGY